MINLLIWRILAIGSGVMFVVCLVLVYVTKILKNQYYHGFTEDELIKESKSVNSKNYLYFTSEPTTYKYIKRYVLCKTLSEKYCICNYEREFNKISFFIIQYNKKKKVIAVTKCVEVKNGEASRVIPLKRRCEYINVIISKVDKMEINSTVIKPHSKLRIILYSFIRCIMSFTLLFGVRHIFVESFGEAFRTSYLNSTYDIYMILGILLFSILNAVICYISLRKRNLSLNRGGVIEYEFI